MDTVRCKLAIAIAGYVNALPSALAMQRLQRLRTSCLSATEAAAGF
jgi:hypothetical protein